jgi:hypothetical protein
MLNKKSNFKMEQQVRKDVTQKEEHGRKLKSFGKIEIDGEV